MNQKKKSYGKTKFIECIHVDEATILLIKQDNDLSIVVVVCRVVYGKSVVLLDSNGAVVLYGVNDRITVWIQ